MSIHLFYKDNMEDPKKTELVGIRMSEELLKVIQKLAKSDRRTVTWMARELIVEALERRGLVKPKTTRKKK